MTGTELHNVYSLLFNDLVAEVTREVHGHGLVWARSSYLGGQRHPAQWSGDVDATYPAMGSTIRGGLLARSVRHRVLEPRRGRFHRDAHA